MRRGVLWDSSAILALLDADDADKDWSLCDAISFAVLESRGAWMAFTFDRHFRQYGRFEILGLQP